MLLGKSHNLSRNYVNLPSGGFSSRLTSTLGHHGTTACNMVTFDQLFAANRSMMYLEAGTCGGPLPCTSEILPMEPVLHPFCTGFRTFITRSLRNLTTSVRVRLKEPIAGFRSQRMCPFCGLITSRLKAFCLECGRPLPAA